MSSSGICVQVMLFLFHLGKKSVPLLGLFLSAFALLSPRRIVLSQTRMDFCGCKESKDTYYLCLCVLSFLETK